MYLKVPCCCETLSRHRIGISRAMTQETFLQKLKTFFF